MEELVVNGWKITKTFDGFRISEIEIDRKLEQEASRENVYTLYKKYGSNFVAKDMVIIDSERYYNERGCIKLIQFSHIFTVDELVNEIRGLFIELEKPKPQVVALLQTWLQIGDLLSIDSSIVHRKALEAIKEQTGADFSSLLDSKKEVEEESLASFLKANKEDSDLSLSNLQDEIKKSDFSSVQAFLAEKGTNLMSQYQFVAGSHRKVLEESVIVSEFREGYIQWCKNNSFVPLSSVHIGRKMHFLGYKKVRATRNKKRICIYYGLSIN